MSNQGQNANDVYFAQLTEYSRSTECYLPSFTFAEDSKRASQIRGKQWDNIMFETSVDIYDDDIEFFKSASSTDSTDHLAYILSDSRRKAEVSLRNLTKEERTLMEEAKDKEVDQWISNSVFKIVRKSGVPLARIMAMRWILSWKEAPEGTKAKARLVAKGFTDPDLLTIRAEAPTLSKIG